MMNEINIFNVWLQDERHCSITGFVCVGGDCRYCHEPDRLNTSSIANELEKLNLKMNKLLALMRNRSV